MNAVCLVGAFILLFLAGKERKSELTPTTRTRAIFVFVYMLFPVESSKNVPKVQ